jgi:serine/threonine protein kinase
LKILEPGFRIDGFVVEECIHAGGMAHIYQVSHDTPEGARAAPSGFEMVMKIPRMTAGDGAENVIGFEVEQQILPALEGQHVPRFVASGELDKIPYLVMEYVRGVTLDHWIADVQPPHPPALIAKLCAQIARALHSLHQQNVCHLDLKPANVIFRPASSDDLVGTAVLVDFGLAWHGHFPDLLAEELRKAVGSPVWIAPEQVVGVRGDPRSDLFALGVMMYELATGELPFGSPETTGGLRQRLWMDPVPPRSLRPDLPEWLQEVILRCLEPEAARRYPSAAHLAFDLSNSDQIAITDRGRRTQKTGVWAHFKRWVRAAGKDYRPSPLPQEQIGEVPIVMVAVPHEDVTDMTLYSLRQAVQRSMGLRPGARLAVITVISSGLVNHLESEKSESTVHRRFLSQLQRWAQPLALDAHHISFHVIEAEDVAKAILRYAEGNHVNLIIMGAATHGVEMQRWVTTVPIKVAMHAPCSIMLVKGELPFERLAQVSDSIS